MIEDKELHDAWDRIARTADGHMIYLHLQRFLMSVTTDLESSTLRDFHGQRMFAAKLIGLMAKGIEESATGLSTRVVTFAVAGPRAVSRAGHGAGRRVSADTIVPGYNDTDPRASGSGGI